MSTADPTDARMIEAALAHARLGIDSGGMPFGAVLAAGGQIIAAAHNCQIQHGDYLAHAEVCCLREALAQAQTLPADVTLYATEAPCPMCAGAALITGIRRVVVGESHHYAGAIDWLAAQGVTIIQMNDPDCIALVTSFRERFPDRWARFSAG